MAVLVHIPHDANDLNQQFLGNDLGKPSTDYAALQSLQKVFVPIESKDVCGVCVQVGAQNLEEEFPNLCFLVLCQVRQKRLFENWIEGLIATENFQDLMRLHGVHR